MQEGRSAAEGIGHPLQYSWASLVAQLMRVRLQHGRPGFSPCVGKILGRWEWLPTPVFWPGEFHGMCSPRGRKESETTEQLSLSGRSSLNSFFWRAVSQYLSNFKQGLGAYGSITGICQHFMKTYLELCIAAM